jgi:hypothetical protein
MKSKALYQRAHYYCPDELEDMWKADLLRDAKHAREQAVSGPFFPEKDITSASLIKYAEECEAQAKQPIPAQFARSQVAPR